MWYHVYVGPLYPRALPVQTGGAFLRLGASVLTVGGQVKVIQHKIPKIQGGFAQKAFFLAHQLHRLFASRKAAPGLLCNNTVKLRNSDIILRKAESLACRGLHCRPATVRGNIFGVCRRGKGGRSGAPPLRQNSEITLKFISTLSRHIVGVGLCSTRGLVIPQGFGGRAMLAPTMKIYHSSIKTA